MKDYFLAIIASLFAGCIVMILHELPRAIYLYVKIKHDTSLKGKYKMKSIKIFKLWRYIDPLGLLFCIISGAGFSKSGIFADEHKFNKNTSLVGFFSLIIQFFISATILKYVFNMDATFTVRNSHDNIMYMALLYLITYIALLSLGMLFTNLFPIRFFDSVLFISGVTKRMLININIFDYKMMAILVFVYFTGIIQSLSQVILILFLG